MLLLDADMLLPILCFEATLGFNDDAVAENKVRVVLGDPRGNFILNLEWLIIEGDALSF